MNNEKHLRNLKSSLEDCSFGLSRPKHPRYCKERNTYRFVEEACTIWIESEEEWMIFAAHGQQSRTVSLASFVSQKNCRYIQNNTESCCLPESVVVICAICCEAWAAALTQAGSVKKRYNCFYELAMVDGVVTRCIIPADRLNCSK
jgi:hypothetical protein